jgi:hypothetical protein
MSNEEIYIMVAHQQDGHIRTDLFKSKNSSNLTNFELSRNGLLMTKNLVSEFQSLNERGGIFIANFDNQKTYMKILKDDWKQIEFEDEKYKVCFDHLEIWFEIITLCNNFLLLKRTTV